MTPDEIARKIVPENASFFAYELQAAIAAAIRAERERVEAFRQLSQESAWEDLRLRTEKAEAALGNLLAIIHRDGGHHTSDVGIEQSVNDAHQTWAALISRAEAAEAERDRLRDALEAIGYGRFSGDHNDGPRVACEMSRIAREALARKTDSSPSGGSTLNTERT